MTWIAAPPGFLGPEPVPAATSAWIAEELSGPVGPGEASSGFTSWSGEGLGDWAGTPEPIAWPAEDSARPRLTIRRPFDDSAGSERLGSIWPKEGAPEVFPDRAHPPGRVPGVGLEARRVEVTVRGSDTLGQAVSEIVGQALADLERQGYRLTSL